MSTVKTLDEYIAEAAKQPDARRTSDIKQIEDSANENIKITNDFYNKAIDNAKVGYESVYQKNAVQKIINQQKIAEKNASLGLTDSGLNRTQQTAAQLSYANQKGKIDIARRNALDELNLNLASAISSINKELEANKLSVNQNYDQLNLQTATNMRNADIEAENQRYQIDENAKLQREQLAWEREQANQSAEIAALKEQLAEYEDWKSSKMQKAASSEQTKTFQASILTNREFARRGKKATINGESMRFDNYTQYVDAVMEKWRDDNKLTIEEVAYLKGYYGIDD